MIHLPSMHFYDSRVGYPEKPYTYEDLILNAYKPCIHIQNISPFGILWITKELVERLDLRRFWSQIDKKQSWHDYSKH